MSKRIRRDIQDNYRDLVSGEVNLARQICINSDERVEMLFSQVQKADVLDTRPAHFGNMTNSMARKLAAQPPIQTLVQQNVHAALS